MSPTNVHLKKDKDTSKFDMALKQTLDSIRARAAWVQVCHAHGSLQYHGLILVITGCDGRAAAMVGKA